MVEYQADVKSVRFQKEDFYILSFEINGDTATVLGNCPYPIKKGEEIKFRGIATQNKKFGTQIKTDLIEIVLPTEKDMIISYLKRSKITGLGGATAEKIYATFGRDTFTILDENPDRLMAVSGIGRKKIKVTCLKCGNEWKAGKK